MAKIRKEGHNPVSREELTDYAPVRIDRAEIEPTKVGESTSDSQDGKGSSPSSGTGETSTRGHTVSPREPAPTTESHLLKGKTASSNVDSTGGRGPTKKAQPSVKKANVRATKDDDF